jgi:phenylacetaldehyde dehydrogenase
LLALKNIKVTEGFDPQCGMGPLVSDEQLERVLGFIEAGEKEGAKTVIGGHRLGDRGYFVEPTLLANVRNGMKVVEEEIFGPVVCAMPFKDADEVAAQMNRTSYGLAGAFGPQTSEAPRAAGKRLGENAFAASLA